MCIFGMFIGDKLNKFWRCRYKDLYKARINTLVETLEVST